MIGAEKKAIRLNRSSAPVEILIAMFISTSNVLRVHNLVRTEGGLSKYLYECEFRPLLEGVKGESCDLDDGQLTPESVLESPDSLHTSPESSASGGAMGCRTLVCTATTEIVKKKRSITTSPLTSYRPTCLCVSEISISLNRKKSLPHWSPLY
ncbi:hypothetical protein NE237_021865 [Protea cynaroides]|uniref:Uncharacterized protein n=1 Tax=Protea cynaroides TaxID=273540 RepID=A0A9Q0K4S4_9MAGN|nr:hypothetical protein NE237_021865 [Protea cynaroides]